MAALDPQTSFNFAVAKVLAILLVVSGHFFDGTLLWIPVTVGLFVFAFSSAYFTTMKYAGDARQRSFWANKIGRLFIPFWITQGFLLLLFLVTDREGIWTWQTAVHWLGQSGWLNWLGIANASPFGAGLWFLTLLLVFYLLYPLLDRWIALPVRAFVSLPVVLLLVLFLDREVKVGHALWLTVFAYWFGIHIARHPVGGSSRSWLYIGIGCVIAMLAANYLGEKSLNSVLLIGISVSAVLWMERTELPKSFLSWTLVLSPAVLEIYLIHTYLFLGTSLPTPIRFAISVCLIVAVALVLSRLAGSVGRSRLTSSSVP